MRADSKRVRDLFLAAARLPTAERGSFLANHCNGDAELRAAVERLLAAHEQRASIVDRTAPGIPTADFAPITEQPGTIVGPYKLLQKIGEGGFGVVYMAEQENPVQRKVALKIIKPGMDTAQVIARFESERQALALMEHPNIAKVFDAGATSSGRPYFIMELVKGVPITEFCDGNRLPPDARLKLFIDVCHAIQHAHHKGVIHRDIKPSNVMVTLHDGVPVAKVIDFGVAKATVLKLTERTLFTAYGQMIGTPAYMSPEQAEMSGLDIDTRSDIYSLGVLLYELLTGTTPLEAKRLCEAGYAEMQRLIREQEAPRPSQRLSSLGDSATVLANNRSHDVRGLTQLLAGDLDWIVMKALDKDRNRRYSSPENFADDIERYLRHDVVLARPPSSVYKLKKFVRRNRTAVLSTAALGLIILIGAGTVWSVKSKADRERAAEVADRAVREAGTFASVAEAVRDARKHADEAWKLNDYPDRMQQATDAALAALRRADGFIAAGTPTEQALAEVASAREAVNDLVRHTRLITACEENRRNFANELNQAKGFPQGQLADRHSAALVQFGLDPVHGDVDDLARSIAASRIRDAILGMMLEWKEHAAATSAVRQKFPQRVAEFQAANPVVKDRLAQVTRSTRRLCGGAYARWQDLLDRKDVPDLIGFAASPEALSFRSILCEELGRDLGDAQQHAARRDYLRAAVERYPHDVWLRHNLINACRSLEPPDWPEALHHASVASLLWPDSGFFQLTLASCYLGLGSYDQAEVAFHKAVSLSPHLSVYSEQMSAARNKAAAEAAKNVEKLDLERLQGNWQRTSAMPGSYLGEATRATKEIRGNMETVTFYDSKGEVLRRHRVAIKLARIGKLKTFSFSDMEILHGPDKGKRVNVRGSYIYSLQNDSFYEANNLLEGDAAEPSLTIWKRAGEVDG